MTVDMKVIPLAIETGIRRFLYLTDIDGAPYEYKLKYVVRDLTKEILEDRDEQEENEKTSSDKPKNMDVYKTEVERNLEFAKFCNAQAGKVGCNKCAANQNGVPCMEVWLNLEADPGVSQDG